MALSKIKSNSFDTDSSLNLDNGTLVVDTSNNKVLVGKTTHLGGKFEVAAGTNEQFFVGSSRQVGWLNDAGTSWVNSQWNGLSHAFNVGQYASVGGMNIDSSGRVTKPYQPCYVGFGRSGNLNTSGEANYTTWIHNNTRINTGTHMNTGTGQFLCPVAGRYLVSFQALIRGSGSFNTAIVKNGSQWNELGRAILASATEANVKTFAIVDCAVNDVLRIDCSNSGGDFYTSHNSTTIFLIG